MSEDNKNLGGIKWFVIASVFVGVITLYGLAWLLTDKFISIPEYRGLFGDKFGAVNALFSGLAFAGLIITLILQRKELSLQREELEQTRGEFVEQNRTQKRQRFENTYFNLVSLHQHITDNLEYECPDGADPFEAKGREVFRKFYIEKNNFNDTWGIKGFLKNKNVEAFLDYKDIYRFNHYFHSFDGILSYIDTSDLLENCERYQYVVMLRNTLSDSERSMLFYYYASSGGWHKQMAEKYALFYDVHPNDLAKEDDLMCFEAGAYNHYSF